MARVIQAFFLAGKPNVATLQPLKPALNTTPFLQGEPRTYVRAATVQASAPVSTMSFEIDPVRVGLMQQGGHPLPDRLLAHMESAFGANFKDVRIHIGAQAQRIGALAFTVGNDVYFAPGQYQPQTRPGQKLIGHELAHVLQQRQGRVRGVHTGVSVVHDGALEAEADRLGQRAASTVAATATPAQIAQLKLALTESKAVRAQIVQMRARPALHRPLLIQRQTPRFGEPNLLGWSPPLSKTIAPYSGADRLGVDAFNETWKKRAIAAWLKNGRLYEHETKNQSMLYARVTTNALNKDQFVPWDGTGIDHLRSARDLGTDLMNIAAELTADVKAGKVIPDWRKRYFSIFAHNSTGHTGWGSNARQATNNLRAVDAGILRILPTQWAAEAYYHDFDNLVPLLSRDNSSKGASQGAMKILSSKTQNMLMQQSQKVATDLQIILNYWDGGAVTGDLETMMKGVRDNLTYLRDFLDAAVQEGKISTPVHQSMSSGYFSPVRI